MSIGKDCWFNLGGELINNGSFEIAGTFENNGKLYSNNGVLSVVSGGRVENLGLIDLYDGLELRVEDGASFRTEDGVLLLRSTARITPETSRARSGRWTTARSTRQTR